MVKIDKDVPIPAPGSSRAGRLPVYPLRSMEVGDSFYIKGNAAKRESVRSAAYHHARTHGGKYTCRSDEFGVRVWRTS